MIGTFLSDASNQRKIAVALCGILALFSSKIPFLADIKPEMLMTLIGAIGAWVLQSGVKAAAQAHADGQVNAAMVANADDAIAVYNHIANGQPLPTTLVASTTPVTAPAKAP